MPEFRSHFKKSSNGIFELKFCKGSGIHLNYSEINATDINKAKTARKRLGGGVVQSRLPHAPSQLHHAVVSVVPSTRVEWHGDLTVLFHRSAISSRENDFMTQVSD